MKYYYQNQFTRYFHADQCSAFDRKRVGIDPERVHRCASMTTARSQHPLSSQRHAEIILTISSTTQEIKSSRGYGE